MRSLRARLDKLTDKASPLPKVVIYQAGEDASPELQKGSRVVIYLPDNHRNDPAEPSISA